MWTRMIAGVLSLCAMAACSTPAPPVEVQIPSPAAPSALAYGTDMAWAQLTIALNERALKTFSLVRDRAADDRLVTLAGELTAAHAGENAQLLAVLRKIGAPQENPHTGHDMPGMATREQIATMAAARDEAFDRLFVAGLRAHLTQCQNLAHSMRQSGSLPDALALAAGIESTRRSALDRLASWGA